MNTVVIQSCRAPGTPAWMKTCMESVREWCGIKGYTWRFIGDELFDCVPGWYMDKTGKGPVAADYARLVVLRDALDSGEAARVVWLDADVFVMDANLSVDSEQSCAFGQETWIQEEQGRLKVKRNVHNAVCVFRRGCVVLPFLAATVASIIRRADPAHIAPQMAGPKLLGALHSLYQFDLLPQAGAVSPAVAADIMAGGGTALDLLLDRTPVPLQAVNLCASLHDEASAEKVLKNIDLLRTGDPQEWLHRNSP